MRFREQRIGLILKSIKKSINSGKPLDTKELKEIEKTILELDLDYIKMKDELLIEKQSNILKETK